MKGEEAKNCLMMPIEFLDKIIDEKMLETNGVIGFYPVNSIGRILKYILTNQDLKQLLHSGF